jgi:hypothetical protein
MPDNQKPDQDPNSWPGVVWRYVKGKPALDVVSIILLLLVGYFIGRLYAVDPLEPVVELAANKFSLPAGPPDISGNWEYTCESYDGQKFWGGNASFRLKKERFGEVIEVSGERTWEASNSDSINRKNISPAISWHTTCGVFVSDEEVQWHYFTHVGDRSEGFTHVSLIKPPGGIERVDRMTGRFSEINKKDPKFGNIEFSRR